MRLDTPAIRTMYALFLAATVLELGFGAYRIFHKVNKPPAPVPVSVAVPLSLPSVPKAGEAEQPLMPIPHAPSHEFVSPLDSAIGTALRLLPGSFYRGNSDNEIDVHAVRHVDGTTMVTAQQIYRRDSSKNGQPATVTIGPQGVSVKPIELLQGEPEGRAVAELSHVASAAWLSVVRHYGPRVTKEQHFRIQIKPGGMWDEKPADGRYSVSFNWEPGTPHGWVAIDVDARSSDVKTEVFDADFN